MNLELDISTGRLFVNNDEFIFYDKKIISNNPYLKKHFMVNGFDTYGFGVVIFEFSFSLNITFKDEDLVNYFFLTFDENCYDFSCLKKNLLELSGLVEKKINLKPKKGVWKSFFKLQWGWIELNAIRQDFSVSMQIHNDFFDKN